MITTNQLIRRFALLHGSSVVSEAWGVNEVYRSPLLRSVQFTYGDGNEVRVEEVDEVLTGGFISSEIEVRQLWAVYAGNKSTNCGLCDMVVLKGRFKIGTLIDDLYQLIENDEIRRLHEG